jgi:tRNA-dihydrouridine synthase
MDDVTDTVFRQIVADLSKPDLFFTEFVNVDGLQSPGRDKLLHKLKFTDKEQPIIAQVWGLKPENYYKSTQELKEMGFAGVDINMGCPVKTVIKNGACAALINNRQLAGEIIDAVQSAADRNFPVSVKTRIGFNEVDLTWVEFLLGKKLDLLTIHGRTAKQLSKVPADWGLIDQARQLRDSVSPDTLIIGNGDVMTKEQAVKLAKKYRLDGVMIGRGIFNDPFVFADESPWEQWSKKQKIELLKKHIQLYERTWKSNERRFEALRKFCKIYISGFDGASALRAKFMETENPAEALDLLL